MTDEGADKAGVIALTVHADEALELARPQHLSPAVQAIKQQLEHAEIFDKDGKPWRPRLSASQIDTYRLCPRKWGWGYLDKIRTPPNKYAALGTAVHKVLERWLQEGVPPRRDSETGQIALPGLKYLPPPGQAVVEGRFYWDLPDEPFDLVGVMDWRDTIDGRPRVGDHKTTGDFKWVKAPGDLIEDVQATIYAKRTLVQTGAPVIKGRWVYYRTVRPYTARCVDYSATVEQVDQRFASILDTGREMVAWHRRKSKAIELPLQAKACDAYGGCPHRDRCNLSPKERLVSLMAHETLKDKIARKKLEKAAQAAATSASVPEATHTPAAPTEVQAAPATAAPVVNPPEGQGGSRVVVSSTRRTGAASGAQSLREKMQARKARASAPASPAPVADSVPAASSVAAPESSGDPEAAGRPATAPVANAQPQRPALSPSTLTDASPASLPAPGVNVPPAVEAELVAMPMPPATTPPPCPAAVVTREHAVWTGPPPVAAPPSNGARKIKLLLVDCAPLDGGDYRILNLATIAPGVSPPLMGEHIDACPLPDNAAVVMSLRTPEGQGAYEALAERAELVIRGF